MDGKDKVFYYCHNIQRSDGKQKNGTNSMIRVKILDYNNNDIILDKFGIENNNELIQFVVHIILQK